MNVISHMFNADKRIFTYPRILYKPKNHKLVE